jgi:fructokinase
MQAIKDPYPSRRQQHVDLYGGIEGGGTKFVCAYGTGPGDIRDEIRYPTSTPEDAIDRAIEFFRGVDGLRAVGIASFGPLDPNPKSVTWGYVTTTPKPGWAHTDFAGRIQRALGLPVGFDTDVNAAALAEYRWGAARGLDSCLYLTVGTGIGGGAVIGGQMIHGMMHPEMGHVRIPHDREADPYPGFCTYHGDCLEGLACGPAMEARWGVRAETLPSDHPAWELEAHYLALGLIAYIVTLSPERIILGGGVMEQPALFPMVRRKVQALLNGYIQVPAITEGIDRYIVSPALGNRAGVLGGIALGQDAKAPS